MSRHNRKTAIRKIMADIGLKWSAAAALHDQQTIGQQQTGPSTLVPFPTGEAGREWQDQFRAGRVEVGSTSDGETVGINIRYSHTLICGNAGSGKSVVANLFLHGVLSNPDLYQIVLVAPRHEYPSGMADRPGIARLVQRGREQTESAWLAEAASAIEWAHQQMTDRLGTPPIGGSWEQQRLVVLLDLYPYLVADHPGDNAKDRQARHTIRNQYEAMLGLGRSTGIHCVTVSNSAAVAETGARVPRLSANKLLMGQNSDASRMQVFGDPAAPAVAPNAPRGSGVLSTDDDGKARLFRGYWLDPDTLTGVRADSVPHPDHATLGEAIRAKLPHRIMAGDNKSAGTAWLT